MGEHQLMQGVAGTSTQPVTVQIPAHPANPLCYFVLSDAYHNGMWQHPESYESTPLSSCLPSPMAAQNICLTPIDANVSVARGTGFQLPGHDSEHAATQHYADAQPEFAEPSGVSCGVYRVQQPEKKPLGAAPRQAKRCMAAKLYENFKARFDTRTTVMLKNIPNNYTREQLRSVLDAQGYARRYDFLYLPFDYRHEANLGYAFVNHTTRRSARHMVEHMEGFRWRASSQKVCQLSWGEAAQGLKANVERYRNSPVMHEDVPDEFKPVDWGVRVDFPPPTKRLCAPRLKHCS